MSKEKKFDVESISGYQYMEEGDKEYFEKFGSAMSNQAELIAREYDVDSETMKNSLDYLINTLESNSKEYIVNGAPLACSYQRDTAQLLTYGGNDIVSKAIGIEEMSVLRLPQDRKEGANGHVFANVLDTQGGLRDEILMEENKEEDAVNIVSFGNCERLVEDKVTSIEAIAEKLYVALQEQMSKRTGNKASIHITKEEVLRRTKEAIEQGKGTCYCCMHLNPEWENMPPEYDFGTNYFRFQLPSAGVSAVLDSESYMQFNGVEGINMMSMVFCRRGGIISAKESGQKNVIVMRVSENLIKLLKVYETGEDVNGKLLSNGEPALKTYRGGADEENVHTIGWGHAMHNEEEGFYTFSDNTTMNLYALGTEITPKQAEEILQSDIEMREEVINNELESRGISDRVDQQFYDALFLLVYQNGNNIFDHEDLSGFLSSEKFNLNDEQEIKYQFGEYSDHYSTGTMRRRADELDIIFYGDYERDTDETRYGDIWGKKTNPNSVTKGYE